MALVFLHTVELFVGFHTLGDAGEVHVARHVDEHGLDTLLEDLGIQLKQLVVLVGVLVRDQVSVMLPDVTIL